MKTLLELEIERDHLNDEQAGIRARLREIDQEIKQIIAIEREKAGRGKPYGSMEYHGGIYEL